MQCMAAAGVRQSGERTVNVELATAVRGLPCTTTQPPAAPAVLLSKALPLAEAPGLASMKRPPPDAAAVLAWVGPGVCGRDVSVCRLGTQLWGWQSWKQTRNAFDPPPPARAATQAGVPCGVCRPVQPAH